ncbi:unnamed protein product [Caenorhabditis angaria]|uniref:Uncharacterized protein n=1 Tax=Caenorhabditis angaria TaxID=860376 RepID=A0A9P1IH61_9PELO|nr:unnamed protein product [Caenorhabditis angaria]
MEILRKAEIQQCASEALEKLDDFMAGAEENESLEGKFVFPEKIDDLVVDFLSSQKGQCCLLEGEPNCGRETILMKVLKKYSIDLRVINVGYAAADPLLQESLARENEQDGEYSVFLIRDADELISGHQQEFLYTMTDKATSCSWLVFFSISRQNFAQNLEKRGNSRIPRIRVTFDQQTPTFDEYCTAFRQMIIPKSSEAEKSTNFQGFYQEMRSDTWLRDFYELYNFDGLKKLAAMILMEVAMGGDQIPTQKTVENALCSLMPSNRKLSILQDQTLRSQCVFLCCHRLCRNRRAESEFLTPRTTFRTVFLEYKKLANLHYAPLNVNNDVFVFREIEHLIEIGLLKCEKMANFSNISFRKIWLDMDALTVEKSISDVLKLPTTVRDFFATILD